MDNFFDDLISEEKVCGSDTYPPRNECNSLVSLLSIRFRVVLTPQNFSSSIFFVQLAVLYCVIYGRENPKYSLLKFTELFLKAGDVMLYISDKSICCVSREGVQKDKTNIDALVMADKTLAAAPDVKFSGQNIQ